MSTNGTKTLSPFIRVKPDTKRKYEEVGRVKRWKFGVIADAAIDALCRSDPELRKLRKQSA